MTGFQEKATADFELIRQTVAQAKTDHTGLPFFWVIYGAAGLFAGLCNHFGSLFLLDGAFVLLGQLLSTLGAVVLPVAVMAGFLAVFLRERRTANKYYLSCLCFWGIPAVAVPVLGAVLRGVAFLLPTDGRALAFQQLSAMQMTAAVLFFCLCTIACALLLRHGWIAVIGLLAVFVYGLLAVLDGFALLQLEWRHAEGFSVRFSVYGLFAALVVPIGYLIVGALTMRNIRRERTAASEHGRF